MNESTEYLRHVLAELKDIAPGLSIVHTEEERDEARSRLHQLIGAIDYNVQRFEQNQNH